MRDSILPFVIGIQEFMMISLISEDKRKKKLYDKGLSMVRRKIETVPLEKVDWDTVVNQISQSPFFRVLRWDAMKLFYTDRIGWRIVNYEGPPLVGYRDYNKC